MAVHLWWWWYGEAHAPGEMAEDARATLARVSGCPPEECGELDEWVMVDDDEYMRDEDGSIPIPAETAAEYAANMARNWAMSGRCSLRSLDGQQDGELAAG